MTAAATPSALTLPALPASVVSVDVRFDGTRVWSIDLTAQPIPEDRTVAWPDALLPHLTGSTEITIRDSGTKNEFARFPVVFSDAEERTSIRDSDGIPLAVNKWGRLGKTLAAGNPGVQERILARTTEIVALLQEMGLRPFIVGGTLLGAVRDGALLPHDDDADVAYLSEHSNPADVAREGFAVGHRLQELGYEVVRHSATHMQLQFRADSGRLDHYLDVFTAFFTDDGHINQPFHVRGELRREQMLPFSTVQISGREYPAPADPEAWLVINYDENWRTPIPGYQLETPRSTVRRFDTWFGAFHFQRDFWNDWFQTHSASDEADWQPGRDWVLGVADELRSATVLELGAGRGTLAAALAAERPGRRVIATDFSHEAGALAATGALAGGYETAHVNLYRTLALAAPQQLGITGPFDVVASHLLEQTGHLARANALRLMRMALRSGGTALATFYGEPAADVVYDDPTGWHMHRFDLAREAKQLGLGIEFEAIPLPDPDRDTAAGAPDDPARALRRRYGARFTLSDRPFPAQEDSLRQRLKRLFMRSRPQSSREALEALTARVAELELELDEYRRDSLRVAELMDLAEQKFTPGTPGGQGSDETPRNT